MRRIALTCFALACLAATRGSYADAALPHVRGIAYDLKSQSPLYSETHCVSDDALKRSVAYRDTDDQLIAHKLLNYEGGPTTPSFVQHNLYDGETVAVELRSGNVDITVTDRQGDPKQVSARPDAELPLVIDAGFDAYVTQHWDALVAGQSKRFQFPVAAQDGLFNLRISAARCSYAPSTDQCFLLELDNWALRWLADSIELGYDAGQKRLVRYRGLSNIGDGAGAGQVVDIRYAYEDLEDATCAVRPLASALHPSGKG